MCIAVAQKKGADTLTETELENGWESNPHGGGYSYIDPNEGKIVIKKFMNEDDFISSYRMDHEAMGEQSPFIVHMRIATHGGVKIETAHPFKVEREVGEMSFAHNGIISNVEVWTDENTSDTMAFGDLYLEFLPQGFLDNSAIFDFIEDYIGYSKLIFLTTEPEAIDQLYIIGEDLGDWVGDSWFSNKSCQASSWKNWTRKDYYGRDTIPYGSYEYYDDTKDLDEWLSRDEKDFLEPEDKSCNVYPMNGEYAGDKKPAMSLVVRANMNSLIIQDSWDRLVEEGKRQGFCELCLFSPCSCSDTCYYCNNRMASCNCECWVSIEDMGSWVGYLEVAEVRRRDLLDEAQKEGMF